RCPGTSHPIEYVPGGRLTTSSVDSPPGTISEMMPGPSMVRLCVALPSLTSRSVTSVFAGIVISPGSKEDIAQGDGHLLARVRSGGGDPLATEHLTHRLTRGRHAADHDQEVAVRVEVDAVRQ